MIKRFLYLNTAARLNKRWINNVNLEEEKYNMEKIFILLIIVPSNINCKDQNMPYNNR